MQERFLRGRLDGVPKNSNWEDTLAFSFRVTEELNLSDSSCKPLARQKNASLWVSKGILSSLASGTLQKQGFLTNDQTWLRLAGHLNKCLSTAVKGHATWFSHPPLTIKEPNRGEYSVNSFHDERKIVPWTFGERESAFQIQNIGSPTSLSLKGTTDNLGNGLPPPSLPKQHQLRNAAALPATNISHHSLSQAEK